MDEQIKLEMNNAYELYRQRPSQDTGKALWKAARAFLLSNPRDLAKYGPILAIVTTLVERKHLLQDTLQKKFGIKALLWGLSRGLGEPLPPRRPGWNDYYMTRWQLMQEQRWASEIHRRTHYTDEYLVGWSAKWMSESQRREDAEFDRQLHIAEVECGCARIA